MLAQQAQGSRCDFEKLLNFFRMDSFRQKQAVDSDYTLSDFACFPGAGSSCKYGRCVRSQAGPKRQHPFAGHINGPGIKVASLVASQELDTLPLIR